MTTMTAEERVRRGYDISEAAKQARIGQDLAYWRTKAPAGGTARSQFEAVLANYEERRIERSDALVAIRAIEAGRSPAPKAVRRPGSTHAASSLEERPTISVPASSAAQPPSHGADDVSSIFELAGYGQQADAEQVATILQHHRAITGSAPDHDQQVVDGIFTSAGYAPKGANRDDGLTAAERAQVDRILGHHQAVTGIQSRSQPEQCRADAEVVDQAFVNAGYAPKTEAQDRKVRQILSHHRAVTGR